MGAEKLNKKRSGALVGGIFLILAVPVCGIQVPVQAFFFLAWIYVILFLEANSYSWNELQEAMVHSCTRAVSPIFFLLCAGAMTGIWNLSGTIPGTDVYRNFVDSSGMVSGHRVCRMLSV